MARLPCRTPTFGYGVYRDLIDDLARDGVNTVILWLAGGFRSKRFPITWQYNAEHENVRRAAGGLSRAKPLISPAFPESAVNEMRDNHWPQDPTT